MTSEQRFPHPSLNFLLYYDLSIIGRPVNPIPTHEYILHEFHWHEVSANEGSSSRVASGGHAGSKLIRCSRAVDAWHVGTIERSPAEMKGNRKGTIRSCAFRSPRTSRDRSIPLSLLSTVYTDVIVSSDPELLTFSYPREKKLFVNQHRKHHHVLWIASVRWFLVDKKISLLFNSNDIFATVHRFSWSLVLIISRKGDISLLQFQRNLFFLLFSFYYYYYNTTTASNENNNQNYRSVEMCQGYISRKKEIL